MKKRWKYIFLGTVLLFLAGCGKKEETAAVSDGDGEPVNEQKTECETETAETEEKEEMIHFVDAHGNWYDAVINPAVEKHGYDLSCFSHDGSFLRYEGDDRYTYRLGVDVSYHNGELDWEKIREDGISFAFIRLGARGYGKEGRVFLDEQFYNNIKNARAAGLDVGVYFFSQAVNEAEAAEEADFVLKNLEGCSLELPVVYDPESILDAEARTDNVSGEQFTENAIVFCEKIKAAGFEPMIYSNMLWEAFKLDLTRLSDYQLWYADYEELPQTPYRFSFWQYTEKGKLSSVDDIDLDIQMIPVK